MHIHAYSIHNISTKSILKFTSYPNLNTMLFPIRQSYITIEEVIPTQNKIRYLFLHSSEYLLNVTITSTKCVKTHMERQTNSITLLDIMLDDIQSDSIILIDILVEILDPTTKTVYISKYWQTDFVKIPISIIASSIPTNKQILPPKEVSFTVNSLVRNCSLDVRSQPSNKQIFYTKREYPLANIRFFSTDTYQSLATELTPTHFIPFTRAHRNKIPIYKTSYKVLPNQPDSHTTALLPVTQKVYYDLGNTYIKRINNALEKSKQFKTTTVVKFFLPTELSTGGKYNLKLECTNITGNTVTYTQNFHVYPPFKLDKYKITRKSLCLFFTRPLQKHEYVSIAINGKKVTTTPKSQFSICTPHFPRDLREFWININSAASIYNDKLTNTRIKVFNPYGYVLYHQNREIIKLPMKWFHQHSALSCEAASIRMALSRFGIYKNENTIMHYIGYSKPTKPTCANGEQPVPRPNNEWGILYCPNSALIWGDPYNGFVGTINGKNGVTGWGVQNTAAIKGIKPWAPRSKAFIGLSAEQALKYVKHGYPVIYWEYYPQKTLQRLQGSTHCWLTLTGKHICWRSGHVKVIAGYSKNLTTTQYEYILIFDPLYGKLKLPYTKFLESFKSYSGRGIVVRL